MFKDVNEFLRNTIRVMAGRRRSFVLVLLLSIFCLSVGVAECWPDFPLSSDGFAANWFWKTNIFTPFSYFLDLTIPAIS